MKRFIIFLLLILCSSFLSAFPENSEARVMMREMITAPASDVLSARDRRIEQFTDGAEVSFQIKQQSDAFYILFVNRKDGRFPIYSEGSYIIKRRISDGKFVQIKVFLKDHTECYARIYPMDERAVMEIVLYGRTIYSDINLPFSFADTLTEPFSEIVESTAGIVDWELILPEIDYFLFNTKQKLASEIRETLPLINDADDGAVDADGSYVYIEDLSLQPENSAGLNCSGFVKWVADAIFYAAAGEYLSVGDLKQKKLDQRGNRWSYKHEDGRDPYFGLDWTRNIAVSIAGARGGADPGYKSADVRDVPWADYVEDVGFPVEDLKLLMYYLAVNEPENIYLASVNVPWGSEPVLRQHVHTAVLLPVIDEDGYHDTVFERNLETNAGILAENYPGSHVHLVRIKTDPGFRFPELKKTPAIGAGSYFRR